MSIFYAYLGIPPNSRRRSRPCCNRYSGCATATSRVRFPAGFGRGHGRLEASLDRLLDGRFGHPADQRLAKHLRHELPHRFTFLRCPGLPATNNFAERAIRLMAIARKTWGGNRTAHGARIQQILASVLRTCWQQGQSAFDHLVKLLRSRRPIVLQIVPAELSP